MASSPTRWETATACTSSRATNSAAISAITAFAVGWPTYSSSVTELEYVGHPTAGAVIAELAEEFAARPGVHAVAVSHRVGLLGIGDIALACAVSASHRGEAFGACAELVDEVKKRLPIWKRQVFTDGEEEWVACP